MEMWESYAILEAMHKPADFIVLNTGEHILVDPAMRLAAQGGNVDWFRFFGFKNMKILIDQSEISMNDGKSCGIQHCRTKSCIRR